jgi:hypothetical protein
LRFEDETVMSSPANRTAWREMARSSPVEYAKTVQYSRAAETGRLRLVGLLRLVLLGELHAWGRRNNLNLMLLLEP